MLLQFPWSPLLSPRSPTPTPRAKEGRLQVISSPGAWRGEGEVHGFFSLPARRPEERELLATPGAFWGERIKLVHFHPGIAHSSCQSYLFPGLRGSVEGPRIHSPPRGKRGVSRSEKEAQRYGVGRGGALSSSQEGRAEFDSPPEMASPAQILTNPVHCTREHKSENDRVPYFCRFPQTAGSSSHCQDPAGSPRPSDWPSRLSLAQPLPLCHWIPTGDLAIFPLPTSGGSHCRLLPGLEPQVLYSPPP